MTELAYWRRRGRTYQRDFVLTPAHARQEAVLLDHLVKGPPFESVLEIGCGFGRIAGRVRDRWDVTYVGVDPSRHMIAAAQRDGRGIFMVGSLSEAATVLPMRFDLVLAVEVLMHIPPRQIGDAVATMKMLGSRIVSIDATEGTAGAHNWVHDYAALGLRPVRRIGRQTLHEWRETP